MPSWLRAIDGALIAGECVWAKTGTEASAVSVVGRANGRSGSHRRRGRSIVDVLQPTWPPEPNNRAITANRSSA